MYVTEQMSEVKEVKEAKEIQEVQEVQEAEEEAEDAQIKHGLGKLKLRGVSSCSMWRYPYDQPQQHITLKDYTLPNVLLNIYKRL
jgi:hypothetical protein